MKSFAEEVSARIESGNTRDEAVAGVLMEKFHDAMIEGTDLEELNGEGKISRDEFLAELMRRIPDAKAFPEAFEKEAWRATSMTSDARQSAIWAAELSKRGAGESLVPTGVSSGNIYGDPRIPLRLNRYQLLCDSIPSSPYVSMIRDRQSYEWSRWHVVAPAQANAWRDALPPESPLREVIRGREDDDQKRKESR